MGRSYEKDYSDGSREAIKQLFIRIRDLTKIRNFYFHDDGCGSGYVVHFLNEMGIIATGTDYSNAAIEFGRSRGNTHIAAGSAADFLSYRKKRPNILFLQHVLEHLHDPTEYLKSLLRLLRLGGYLVIFIPNRNYLPVKKSGFAEDPCFLYPMHLNYFTPESLRCAIRKAGYNTRHLEATGNFGFTQDMKARLLKALTQDHPELIQRGDEEKIDLAREMFVTYELFCIAKARFMRQVAVSFVTRCKQVLPWRITVLNGNHSPITANVTDKLVVTIACLVFSQPRLNAFVKRVLSKTLPRVAEHLRTKYMRARKVENQSGCRYTRC